ncbi:MAG: hypothetical protein JWQ78_538 [Sediminibacterium sp.]|nr:hypothetical protein [Sediminibacterium sp.]
MNRNLLPFIVCLGFFLVSCGGGYHQFASKYTFSNPGGRPDYSLPDYWAAHPAKHDLADSVPRPLRDSYHPDTTADVFFIHPTTYTAKEKTFGWNAPVDDPDLNAKTDYSTILYQASIFNEAGRVFSPRYRQAHLSSYYPQNAADSASAKEAFELAYQDVKAAFQYYLQYENHGRPIIIAAHSQGSTHGKRLLKEFFDGQPLQQQLVVAYLVGMPLEPDYFGSIKACTSPAQTGCACSWRTFREGFIPDYIRKETFVSVVTNPLSWDAGISEVPRSGNRGAVLVNFNSLVKRVSNAKVHEGVLWTGKPHFFGNIFLTSKNYHIADMNLFYLSIRQNVKQRLAAAVKK